MSTSKKHNYPATRSKGIEWNKKEIDILRSFYKELDFDELTKKLNQQNPLTIRSKESIKTKASKLGLKRHNYCGNYIKWNDDEIEVLRKYYGSKNFEYLAKKLHEKNPLVVRSKEAIKREAFVLGLKRGNYWTEKEEEYLEELAGDYPLSEITRLLNRFQMKNKLPLKTSKQIKYKLFANKLSCKVNMSSEFFTTNDISLLLGCTARNAHYNVTTHQKELEAILEHGGYLVKRAKLKSFFLNHQDILVRYQKTLNLPYLLDLLTN